MKIFKRYLYLAFLSIIIGILLSFLIHKFIQNNIINEAKNIKELSFQTKKLTDLYIICNLDYKYNPKGKEIKKECIKLENKIKRINKRIDNSTKYYQFFYN